MKVSDRIEGFFLTPSAPTNLAVCRIVFFGWLFLLYLTYDPAEWAHLPAPIWAPVWFVGLAGPLPSPGTLTGLGFAWKISLALGAIGLWRRISLGVAAVLGAYLLGLTGSFGKDNYDVSLPVILLFVFWIARSTDALSLDAVLARRRGAPAPSPSGEYTWPLITGRVLLALTFFAAGVAKLRHSGLEWITSDNLRWLFIGQQYTHSPPLRWAASLAERLPWACHLLAAGTVAIEVGYPLALFTARLRPWLVVGAIGLQIGIHLFMGIDYLAFLVANVVWVDWQGVARTLRRRVERSR